MSAGSGFDGVSTTADIVQTHSRTGIAVPKSGYLYIYCSNESDQDVYFDNLQVVHNRAELLEERHYYPQGLVMTGLSSMAFGKLPNDFGYQGKELQSREFYDGSGLEEYDFEARYYDPQLARWHTQDPKGQFASPYNSMATNWVSTVDPDGQFVWFVPLIYAGANLLFDGVQGNLHTFGDGLKSFALGAVEGTLAQIGCPDMTWKVAVVGALSSHLPAANIPIGDFNISISPGFAFGANGWTVGTSVGVTYTHKTFSIGLAVTTGYNWGSNDNSNQLQKDTKGSFINISGRIRSGDFWYHESRYSQNKQYVGGVGF